MRNEEQDEVDPSAPLGSISLNDGALQSDWRACEGYIAFSAELLRISLLAISGLAALCLKVHEKGSAAETIPVAVFRNSFVALTIAAGLSLTHRYLANDAMAFHIEALRRRKRNRPSNSEKGTEIESDTVLAKRQEFFRNWLFRASNWALIGAAALLILGLVLAGMSMTCVVTDSSGK